MSKTRKGLWKSDMNKHWLIIHAAEFIEAVEPHSKQEMEIALLLSPSEFVRLSNEWQLEYDLEEGDLLIRKGRAVHLSRGMVIARSTSKDGSMRPLKRRRTAYEQVQSGEAPSSEELSPESLTGESGRMMIRKRTSTAVGLASNQLQLPGINSSDPSGKRTGGEGTSFDRQRQQPSAEASPGRTADLLPVAISNPRIEPHPADAFTAMTFCFPGFEDDMTNMFGDCVQEAE